MDGECGKEEKEKRFIEEECKRITEVLMAADKKGIMKFQKRE